MTAKTKEHCPLCETAQEVLEVLMQEFDVTDPGDLLHIGISILTQILHNNFTPEGGMWKPAIDQVTKGLTENLEHWDAHDGKQRHH